MPAYEEKTKPANLGGEPKLFPDKRDDETLGWLQSRWLEMDGARDDTRWEQLHDQEESEVLWNEDGTANVNLPIERSQGRLREADESAQKPIIRFKPTEPDDVEKVELTEEVWDHVWNDANTEEWLSRSRQCKRIFGTLVWKEFIQTEIVTRHELKKESKTGKLTSTPQIIESSWIQGKLIDIRNFWLDPVHNQDDAVDCFEVEVDIAQTTLENLRNDPNYKNIDEALKSMELTSEVRNRVFFTREENRTTVPLQNPKYQFFHYYNKAKGIYIVSVNLQVIIREGVNPCPTGGLPYVIGIDEEKYMSLYGRGINEQLETPKYELNVTTNQTIDLIRESSTNTLLLGEGASVEDSEIVNGIGRILNISGSNEYEWNTPPNSDKGLFNLRTMLQTDATMATGIDAYSIQGDTARTLGQEEIREINRLKSIIPTVRNWNFFLVRMARLRLAYIQFYITETTGRKIVGNKKGMKIIAIEGKEVSESMGVDGEGKPTPKGITFNKKEGHTGFLELTPSMIRSSLDISVETPVTSTALKQIRKAKNDEIFKDAIAMAEINPALVPKISKFLEELLKQRVEDAGGDPENLFEQSTMDKKELRKSVVGDLPEPFKPIGQPEPQKTDELAAVAGVNLGRETQLQTQ